MEKLLGALDPRAADIVRGFGLRGETTADTAARLGMTEGAVRVACTARCGRWRTCVKR